MRYHSSLYFGSMPACLFKSLVDAWHQITASWHLTDLPFMSSRLQFRSIPSKHYLEIGLPFHNFYHFLFENLDCCKQYPTQNNFKCIEECSSVLHLVQPGRTWKKTMASKLLWNMKPLTAENGNIKVKKGYIFHWDVVLRKK